MSTSEKAYFCPSCGGANINVSVLAGGPAFCLSCKWEGTKDELAIHVFQHDLGDDVLRIFASEFKQLMGKHLATPLAKLLHKWGFFPGREPTPAELTRYLVAVGRASINAILEVRKELEKERVSGGN